VSELVFLCVDDDDHTRDEVAASEGDMVTDEGAHVSEEGGEEQEGTLRS